VSSAPHRHRNTPGNTTEHRSEIARLKAGSVPAVDSWLGDLAGVPVPFVRLEARRRPDIADLVRPHRLEGKQTIADTFVFATLGLPNGTFDSLVFVEITYRRPVRCRFRLCFDLDNRRDRATVDRIAASGFLGIVTATPDDVASRLIVEIDPKVLRQYLSFVKPVPETQATLRDGQP
jgi:hypothetical protein